MPVEGVWLKTEKLAVLVIFSTNSADTGLRAPSPHCESHAGVVTDRGMAFGGAD